MGEAILGTGIGLRLFCFDTLCQIYITNANARIKPNILSGEYRLFVAHNSYESEHYNTPGLPIPESAGVGGI